MFIHTVVMLAEVLKSTAEIGTNPWRVIVVQRAIVQVKNVVFVIRKVRNFLPCCKTKGKF